VGEIEIFTTAEKGPTSFPPAPDGIVAVRRIIHRCDVGSRVVRMCVLRSYGRR